MSVWVLDPEVTVVKSSTVLGHRQQSYVAQKWKCGRLALANRHERHAYFNLRFYLLVANLFARGFFAVPLFSCEMFKTSLHVMRNNTRQNREAFEEIFNRAAWDYAYLHSWKRTYKKNDGSVAILKRHDKRLSYCIHNHSVREFKAYKVRRTRLQWHGQSATGDEGIYSNLVICIAPYYGKHHC